MPSTKYKINPLVAVCVPTLSDHPLSWEWADAYYGLQFPLGCSSGRIRWPNLPVDKARNACVHDALKSNADYVLFVGDDVLCPPDTFKRLWAHKEADMVTGVYWTKEYPSLPYLWNGLIKGPYLDWKAGEYFQVDFAGCDCLLVNTDVFRNIPEPWFSTEWTFEQGQKSAPILTEDFYFYTKAREAGYALMCDSAVQCGHQDRTTKTIYALMLDMPQAQPTAPHPSATDKAMLVADIGSGLNTPHFGFQANITRYDGDPYSFPDVRCDLREIPAPDEHFDLVHSRHVLEHFMYDEAVTVVKEWTRILKTGGELRIEVPNLVYAATEILKSANDPKYDAGIYPLWQLYGRQDGSFGEVHRNGFTPNSLSSLLERCGFTDMTVGTVGGAGESIEARALKTVSTMQPPAIGPVLRKAIGVPEDEPERRVEGVEPTNGAFAQGGVIHNIAEAMKADGFDVDIQAAEPAGYKAVMVPVGGENGTEQVGG
jgi:hypothetical protein